jgi:hypothetical protein
MRNVGSTQKVPQPTNPRVKSEGVLTQNGGCCRRLLLGRSPLWLVLWLFALLPLVSIAGAAEPPAEPNSAQIMESFARQAQQAEPENGVSDKTKRVVMFLLGVPLLIFLLITGVLGIAMGVYGKQVFVPHMVFAGLTVTLAVVHAIVGLVWFYPF